ncbi:uncharacterized protein THITE_2110760 [Thermothielavioides terrestris NRRL 8126]|uniref:Extracellular membrane protein CFEM domain-containing protein n=1 Tax=Thermothielavioides terrestris (strain ATCC 38088 / NRRL 8126) TaxID=578455 RepID=G2QUH3_THETT|nr:uncharacterized protein THITE_2110760 [Thermothielavioides terrestris NRRL 8126]AEO64528.1 hypothetical protein THITE_2110760 [Thermothielavioides terrestris NRRL 8126]
MKAFLFPLAVLASSAAAQTSSACAADYIVEACLTSEKAKLAACQNTDYVCQCNEYQNMITCFNNCPNDPREKDVAGQRDIFCGYASQFASTTTPAAAKTSASTPAQTTGADQNASPTAAGGSTSTSSAGGPANTNSAADLVINAGSVLAAVAGAVAVVL